jgi:hypothetical protein
MTSKKTTETHRHSATSAPAADRLRDALAEMIRQHASDLDPWPRSAEVTPDSSWRARSR